MIVLPMMSVTQLGIQELVLEAHNNILRISIESQDRVLAALVTAHVQIHSFNPVSQTLEDVPPKERVNSESNRTNRQANIGTH